MADKNKPQMTDDSQFTFGAEGESAASPPLAVGTDAVKVRGYPFPGEVRAIFTNRAGDLRYVVEAIGHDYAGMLHIFSPDQVRRAPACSFCGKAHAGRLPCRHCGEPDIPEPEDYY